MTRANLAGLGGVGGAWADKPVTLDPEQFVTGLYRSFLSREPDAEGLEHNVGKLKAGLGAAQLVAEFLISDEYRSRQRLAVERARIEEGLSRDAESRFPLNYNPPGEAGRSYVERVKSGFLDRYCTGERVLDVGFCGYDNPERKAALPGAIGVDLDYPGYDGVKLPFEDGSIDSVFSSHCLEHIHTEQAAVQDWYRVLRIGGFIVCIVPSQALYEKRRSLPSRWNPGHVRMYSPASLAQTFEAALPVNGFRLRHLAENDRDFNYALGPDTHSDGAYEIELVVEKIAQPDWLLA